MKDYLIQNIVFAFAIFGAFVLIAQFVREVLFL